MGSNGLRPVFTQTFPEKLNEMKMHLHDNIRKNQIDAVTFEDFMTDLLDLLTKLEHQSSKNPVNC